MAEETTRTKRTPEQIITKLRAAEIELAAGLFVYIRATRYLGIEEFWNQGPVKRVLDRLRLSWL